MKRIIAILLTLLLVFSLAACDNGDNPNGDDPLNRNDGTTQGGENTNPGGNNDNPGGNTDNPGTNTPDIDFGAIMGGNGATDTVWGQLDEATKQQIINDAKADGYEVSFGADGSMTVVDTESGETMIQKPDGTWVIKGDDGSEGQFGGEWPENEFTKLLPKPDFTLMAATTSESKFTVAFQNATIEQIRAYVEEVKTAGFTIDATTEDQSVMGIIIYSYVAKNADGYIVSVACSAGVSTIEIEKP